MSAATGAGSAPPSGRCAATAGASTSTASASSSWAPTRARRSMALGEADAADLAADVKRAIDANLDMLRIHGHVTRPEVYAAADEAGLLLWQDVPLQWGYARGARKPAAAQARSLVDLLGHHPSVVVWCGHNEPYPGPPSEPEEPTAKWRNRAQLLLPSWNKDVLDRSVARALRQDPTRPVVDALRRAARAAARRHRQPPLLRLVPGDDGRHGRRAAALAPAGPVRVGVRRPGRARVGRLHGAASGGRTSTGRSSRSATTCNPSTSNGSPRPTSSPPSTTGGPPPRTTRRRSSSCRPRISAGCATGRPGASCSSASPTAIPA